MPIFVAILIAALTFGGAVSIKDHAYASWGGDALFKNEQDAQSNTAVRAARRDLANKLSVQEDQIKIIMVEAHDWPNACLALENTGEYCAQVIIPGYSVVLRYGGAQYRYRSNIDGSVLRIESAPSATPTKSFGILKGSMSIGPVCPVERIGEPCTPTPEMYAAHKAIVYRPDHKSVIAIITPDANGKFSLHLNPGEYWVDMQRQTIGSSVGLPTKIEIEPRQTVILAIHIDTGIR